MKKLNNAGFSMVEVLVSTLLFAMVIATVSSSLMVASRLNGKARRLTEARLAVASAVETIMAEGVDETLIDPGTPMTYPTAVDGVTVTIEPDAANSYLYSITAVSDSISEVSITTSVMKAEPAPGGGD